MRLGGPGSGRGKRWIVAWLGSAFLVLSMTAVASAAPVYLSSFGPDGPGESNFERAGSVAVDEVSGNVYVLDTLEGTLSKFDSEGEPVDYGGSAAYISGNVISGLTIFGGRGESQVAVNPQSHVIYVTGTHEVLAFQEDGEPANFTAGPGAGSNEIPGIGELLGVAVDADGNIYASDYTAGVLIFSEAGEPITQFSVSTPANIAVAPDGSVYVVRYNGGTAIKFTASEAHVTPSTTYTEAAQPVDPRAAYSVATDPTNGNVYLLQQYPTDFQYSQVSVYDQNGVFLEHIGEKGQPGELYDNSSGISVNGAAMKIYVSSDDSIGGVRSQVRIFGPEVIPEGPPSVESMSVTDVTADSATLRAVINPNSFDTTYFLEYGTSDCASGPCARVPLGGASIGAGHEAVAVSQDIFGLQAATTYHFRVVAQNKEGVTTSESRTFTTQFGAVGFRLSDSRVWEMVSPASKHGGELGLGGLNQAAADGNGLAYGSLRSIEENPDGNRAFEGSTVLARRSGDGWVSRDITPPNIRVVPLGAGLGIEYNLFNPDLGRAILEPRDGTGLSPDASERTPYLRQNSEPPVYVPLVTGKPGVANVPPGTEFGGSPGEAIGLVRLVGANPALTHVVLVSEVPLQAGISAENALYLWRDGQLHPVSALPADEGGNVVSARWIGSGPGSVRHAISDDGSRIFWSVGSYGTTGNALTALYLRDTLAEETTRLDVMQPGASDSGEARPTFLGASADGRVVFFTDSHQLAPGASPSGRDLYRCVIPIGGEAEGCAELTDITAPMPGSGESSDVLGLAPAISNDGSRIYFAARGKLDNGVNKFGASAVAGKPNLYLWQAGQGIRFIATLAEGDSGVWGKSPGSYFLLNSSGSPNGRYLTFMSEESLTGRPNEDASSGEPVPEVFRYDAAATELVCLSCNPTGAAPDADEPRRRPLVDPVGRWEGVPLAATVPEPFLIETQGISMYQPRAVLDNGRTFINVFNGLVPADSNGTWDVYQFEPTGVGDCAPSSGGGAVARVADGCISLISSGTAEREAGFIDAGESGDDAFFLTSARLSVLDVDAEVDAYDARVNGTVATLPPVSECVGESCQAVPTPPNDPTPASEAFRGPGNSVRCPRLKRKGQRKVKRRARARCTSRKHRKNRRHRSRSKKARGVPR
jgi:hypothetical protein